MFRFRNELIVLKTKPKMLVKMVRGLPEPFFFDRLPNDIWNDHTTESTSHWLIIDNFLPEKILFFTDVYECRL